MRAIYPGSFDPVTLGHMDIISRAAARFDTVVVGILHNPEKPSGAFPVQERVALLEAACAAYPNVAVQAFTGLLVEAAAACGADVALRGLRNGADAEPELQMARLNRQIGGVETLLMASSPEVSHISATMVRQIGACGGDLSGLVPEAVRARVMAAFDKKSSAR